MSWSKSTLQTVPALFASPRERSSLLMVRGQELQDWYLYIRCFTLSVVDGSFLSTENLASNSLQYQSAQPTNQTFNPWRLLARMGGNAEFNLKGKEEGEASAAISRNSVRLKFLYGSTTPAILYKRNFAMSSAFLVKRRFLH